VTLLDTKGLSCIEVLSTVVQYVLWKKLWEDISLICDFMIVCMSKDGIL